MPNSFLRFAADVTDDTLPRLYDYGVAIGQDARTLAWYVPTSDRITLDGSSRISAWTDRAAAGRNMSQAGTTKRPGVSASVAAINNKPSAEFLQSVSVEVFVWPGTMPTGGTATWTKVALVRPSNYPTGGSNNYILAGNPAATGRHLLQLQGANKILHRVGTSGTESSAPAYAYTPETWYLVFATWEGSTGTAGLSINGGAWSTAVNAAAICSDATLGIGGPPTGSGGVIAGLADVMILNVSLRDPAQASFLTTIKQYFRDRYGIAVA